MLINNARGKKRYVAPENGKSASMLTDRTHNAWMNCCTPMVWLAPKWLTAMNVIGTKRKPMKGNEPNDEVHASGKPSLVASKISTACPDMAEPVASANMAQYRV